MSCGFGYYGAANADALVVANAVAMSAAGKAETVKKTDVAVKTGAKKKTAVKTGAKKTAVKTDAIAVAKAVANQRFSMSLGTYFT